MATLLPESHHMSRRECSPRPRDSSTRRPSRPRLLRACATEPSITTSNSCTGVLTAPDTSRRATELLSRVAISNSTAEGLLRLSPTSPSSIRSFGIETGDGTGRRHSEAAQRTLLHNGSQQRLSHSSHYRLRKNRDLSSLTPELDSACYFSFPSFDAWDEPTQQPEEKTF